MYVCSVLRVAGMLKRAEPDMDEAAVLMRALRDFNVPKIVSDDLGVFLALISDLFPSITVEPKPDDDFDAISKVWPSTMFRLCCAFTFIVPGFV